MILIMPLKKYFQHFKYDNKPQHTFIIEGNLEVIKSELGKSR